MDTINGGRGLKIHDSTYCSFMHLSMYSTNVELSTYSILKLVIKAPPQTPCHKVISGSSGFYYAFFLPDSQRIYSQYHTI